MLVRDETNSMYPHDAAWSGPLIVSGVSIDCTMYLWCQANTVSMWFHAFFGMMDMRILAI